MPSATSGTSVASIFCEVGGVGWVSGVYTQRSASLAHEAHAKDGGGGTSYREAMEKARALLHLAAVLHRGSARMASQLTTGEEFEDGPAPPAPIRPQRNRSHDG